MSEVKEHSVIYLSPSDDPEREWCQDDVWEQSVRYNLGTDFDRVTAERDAALEDLRLAKQLQTTTDAIVVMVDGQRDHWIGKCHALQQRLTAADERVDVLERDKARIDWLAEQPVDTLYLDDGRIIDIAGRVDLRDSIDAAMAAPAPSDDDFQTDHADANESPCSACFAPGCNGECMENL